MTRPVIPEGQAHNQIDATLSLAKEPASSSAPRITLETQAHPEIVKLGPGADAAPQLQLHAYCRYTKLLLHAGDGSRFEPSIENPSGDIGQARYQATVSDDGARVEIAVDNAHRVADPFSHEVEKASLQQLAATLASTGDSPACRFSILLATPPYRQVDVAFSIGADGQGTFEYTGDIDTKPEIPEICTPRDGAAYFTLTGARFHPDKPFDFDHDGQDACITDVGTNGKEAILTDLYMDAKCERPKQHSFYIQVVDDTGELFRSEDPTIVNVSASDPPPGGRKVSDAAGVPG